MKIQQLNKKKEIFLQNESNKTFESIAYNGRY